MRVFIDSEFQDDGRTISLISVGMVRQDGKLYYAESREFNWGEANSWLEAMVKPKLGPFINRKTLKRISEEVRYFVGERPEFWGYYADFDWVAVCRLYGGLLSVPQGWPHLCLDVRQLEAMVGEDYAVSHPQKEAEEHHALNDALWCLAAWRNAAEAFQRKFKQVHFDKAISEIL